MKGDLHGIDTDESSDETEDVGDDDFVETKAQK